MTFAQLDDRFDDHPKYAEYGAGEMGLISCAITYANRNQTDGRIPRIWPERRFGREGVKIAATLVEDKVWARLEDGSFEIVGFLQHNRSRAEIASARAADRDRKASSGRRGGQASGTRRRDGFQTESGRTGEVVPTGIQSASEALSDPLRSDPPPTVDPRAHEAGESGGLDPLPPATLERRTSLVGGRPVETPIQFAGVTEAVRAACFTAGVKIPTDADVVNYRAWHADKSKPTSEQGFVAWVTSTRARGEAAKAPRAEPNPNAPTYQRLKVS